VTGIFETQDFFVQGRPRSFSISSPEIVGIAGVDGIGKSLFLKSLAGVVSRNFSSGNIRLAHRSLRELSAENRRTLGVFYLGEKFAWLDHFSAKKNLLLHFGPISKHEIRFILEQASQIIEKDLLKLEDTSSLTREERVFILLKAFEQHAHPKVLLFDCPFFCRSGFWQKKLQSLFFDLKAKACCVFYAFPTFLDFAPKVDSIFFLEESQMTIRKISDEQTNTVRFYATQSASKELKVFPSNLQIDPSAETISFVIESQPLSLRQGEILGLFHRNSFQDAPIIQSDRPIQIVNSKRKRQGLFDGLSGGENLALSWLHQLRSFKVFQKKSKELGAYYGSLLRWRALARVRVLSRIEILKLSLSRALIQKPKIIQLRNFSRGLDLSERNELYQWVRHLSESGLCIIWESDEIEELLGLSHQICGIFDSESILLQNDESLDVRRLIEAFSRVERQKAEPQA
jgi:ABC-type sugar transport system ATPase subunit